MLKLMFLFVLGLIGSNVQYTAAQGHACFIGIRVTVNGYVYSDNSTSQYCLNDAALHGTDGYCALYQIDSSGENYTAYVESGECVYGNKDNYTCAAAEAESGTEFDDCNVTTCRGFACNSFTPPSYCPPEPENDVNVLPACTLRTVMNRMLRCTEVLGNGYPYSDRSVCLSNMDQMIACVGNVTVGCLRSSCPTALDFIPDLLQGYKTAVAYAPFIRSRADLYYVLSQVLGNQSSILGLVELYTCPLPGQKPPLPSEQDVASMILDLQNPVCDSGLVRDLAVRGIRFVHAFYEAKTSEEVCTLVTSFFNDVNTMFDTRCVGINGLANYIGSLISSTGPPYNRLAPMVSKAVTVGLQVFREIQLPTCGGGGDTIDCRFYQNTTGQCNLRDAWLCDYAAWNRDIVLPFMQQLQKWLEVNPVDLQAYIPQPLYFPSDLCTNPQQRRCIRFDPYSYTFCYCRDHKYRSLAVVYQLYRTQLASWRHFMSGYQGVLDNFATC